MGKNFIFSLVVLVLLSFPGLSNESESRPRHSIQKRCTNQAAAFRACCRFPEGSRKYNRCCMQYGCCPNCAYTPWLSFPRVIRKRCDGNLASECCRHEMGSQEFHHCCKGYGCSPYCRDLSYCTDNKGEYHDNNSSWNDLDNPCILYTCENGEILENIQDCAWPLPCDYYVRSPGMCCPRCDDEEGNQEGFFEESTPNANLSDVDG